MEQQKTGDRRGAVSLRIRRIRGTPPLLRVGGGCVEDLVYVDCPVCARQIEEPFNPNGGPQVFIHRHSKHRNARLIVFPSESAVIEVPHHISLERALREAIRKAS